MKLLHIILSIIILLFAYNCPAEPKTSENTLNVSKQTRQLLENIAKLSKEKSDRKPESDLLIQWKRDVEEFSKNKENLKKGRGGVFKE